MQNSSYVMQLIEEEGYTESKLFGEIHIYGQQKLK